MLNAPFDMYVYIVSSLTFLQGQDIAPHFSSSNEPTFLLCKKGEKKGYSHNKMYQSFFLFSFLVHFYLQLECGTTILTFYTHTIKIDVG